MRRLLFLISLFFIFSTLYSQSNLNDYSFVVVPEYFEFTSEKDQFQLNSMAKYYLEKNGFNAFFQSELPSVNNCDGLYAEVISEGSFFVTSMRLLLKDCKGNVVYDGINGTSKKKEYRQAYQESLREAFKSLEKLNVNQTDIIIDTSTSNVAAAAARRLAEEKNEILNGNNNIENKSIENVKSDNSVISVGPVKKFNHYKEINQSYLLRTVEDSYWLYVEDNSTNGGLRLLGIINKNTNQTKFIMKGDMSGVVTFQNNGDMIISTNSGRRELTFQH